MATTVKIECSVPYDVDADEMIAMTEPINPTVKYESNDATEIDVKNGRSTRALITVEPDIKSVSNYGNCHRIYIKLTVLTIYL